PLRPRSNAGVRGSGAAADGIACARARLRPWSTGRQHGRPPMSRPARIPDRGDVAPSVVATLLGLSTTAEFEQMLPELNRRGFPSPDPTTGRYCIEAVDRWRRRRHPQLFPELTMAVCAVDARAVVEDRLATMRTGKR